MLNAEFSEVRDWVPYRRADLHRARGRIFDYRFGKLPYRSLEFRFETVAAVTSTCRGDQLPERLCLHARDRVQASDRSGTPVLDAGVRVPAAEGDPYTGPRPENAELYKQYSALADITPGVHFVGTAGDYRYYNMDQVVAQALAEFERIVGRRPINAAIRNGYAAADCSTPVPRAMRATDFSLTTSGRIQPPV